MELFDTHAHVYDKRFDNDREQVLSDVFAHLNMWFVLLKIWKRAGKRQIL